MKARITCNKEHALGNMFEQLFDVEYFSRSTGFDIHRDDDLNNFLENTHNYDITINLSRAMVFGQSKLLSKLEAYCHKNKLNHKVLNIGSYEGSALMFHPDSSYDIEKATLKLMHKKIAFEHMFFDGYLDSYMLNLNYLEKLSLDIEQYHPHLNTLSLQSAIDNAKYMLDHPYIKEMYVQYKQPGNFRMNEGVGIVLPGVI